MRKTKADLEKEIEELKNMLGALAIEDTNKATTQNKTKSCYNDPISTQARIGFKKLVDKFAAIKSDHLGMVGDERRRFFNFAYRGTYDAFAKLKGWHPQFRLLTLRESNMSFLDYCQENDYMEELYSFADKTLTPLIRKLKK